MKSLVVLSTIISLMFSSLHAQWVQTSGPEGGAVFSIFADGSNLFAGTSAAGVFRSTDGGATWEQKISGMGYQAAQVIDRIGPYLLASGTIGLYRSTDDGESWTPSTGLPGGNGVRCLAFIGGDVFAGTSGRGVYHSTDSGATWSAVNTGLPGGGANTFVGSIVANGSILLASATNNNIQAPMYRSTDMGASWSLANTGLPSDFSQYNAMYRDGSTIYAGGSFLYKTTNNGDSWTQADNGIPQYSGVNSIWASGSNIFAAAFNYLYRSTDGGTNWAPVGGGLPFMNMFAVEGTGSDVYAGTVADGVYKSTDNGNTWTPRNSGLRARDMSGFIIDGSTIYGNGNSIFKTTDGADTWSTVRGNLKDSSSQPTLAYANGSTLFARNYPAAGLARSTDGGATWTDVGAGLSAFGTVTTIIDVAGGLLTASNRVYRSTDNGDTWVQVDTAITGFVGFTAVARIGSTIYAYGTGIIKSTDDGTTWVKADTGIAAFFAVGGFTSVGSTLFAGGGFPNAIYKSTNGGSTWTSLVNLPGGGGGASQLLGLGNDLYACVPNNGIYISKNLGTSWTKISTGLPINTFAYSFAIHNGWMYAGTSGNSVWKRPLSDVTAVEEIPSVLPRNFALEQNYPNPFNPVTSFRFQVSSFGWVSLKVYDLLGREVATLVDEELHAGRYGVTWNAYGYPSGAYYYRLTAGEFNSTGKMLLTK